jgi:hypothetical protein
MRHIVFVPCSSRISGGQALSILLSMVVAFGVADLIEKGLMGAALWAVLGLAFRILKYCLVLYVAWWGMVFISVAINSRSVGR